MLLVGNSHHVKTSFVPVSSSQLLKKAGDFRLKNSALLTSTPRVNSALTKTYMDKNGLIFFRLGGWTSFVSSIKHAVVSYGHKHEKAIRFETGVNR